MAFFLPDPGSRAEKALKNWRNQFIMHHNRTREFAISWGASGMQIAKDDGTIYGLVFQPNVPLPAGWKWTNARKQYAVPNLTSQMIADQAASRRARDTINSIGVYTTQAEVAGGLGFHTAYEWDSGLGKGCNRLGPDLYMAQVLFVGDDGPVCLFAPHARRAHDLFVAENLKESERPSFKCLSGADKWEVPEGFSMILQSEWELMSAQYRVTKEKSANG